MATHHHDALWAKLHELELQLAAYKLLCAAREDDAGFAFADGAGTPGGSAWTCRGRRYDAYMRRRDARHVAVSAEQRQHQPANDKVQQPRGVHAHARRGRESHATVSHHRPSEEDARRRVDPEHPEKRRRDAAEEQDGGRRREGEPGEAVALAPPEAEQPRRRDRRVRRARPRKRWGSPERPTATLSVSAAADSHRELSKGLRKLLSFVRKGGRSGGGDQPLPALSSRGSGKPVSKGWSGCSQPYETYGYKSRADARLSAQHFHHCDVKFDKMFAAFTGQPLDMVQQWTERDRFMSSSEAMDFGLLDALLETRYQRRDTTHILLAD
ncbi:ATP-dependent Clp protease proteolytic subunit 6, chloroplastic [Zea mays]|uniref:ATP-dependent Clp protease proteolytic subunit 6, chloroplastic n=1 Tax=Zea mays TaxID=4577 RepID=A0A3L6DVZ2_MAIZE|nr:ATP-dependent Clp protease proteolytic subunit 6, chloroplastic [Zea mays]